MKIIKNRWFKILIFIFIFVFTFILRAHNYEKTPGALHLDEMLYAWSGIYLIETGVPVSWSTLDYPKRAEVFKGIINYKGGQPETSVTLYKPWLDEPPLFSLIVGFFAHINGAARTDFIPSSYIRIPSIIFASLVSIFIFLIALSSSFALGPAIINTSVSCGISVSALSPSSSTNVISFYYLLVISITLLII